MNSNTPRVSVIVPHYQDLDRLDTCLNSLSRQSFPREHFEIVVADNASPVGADAVAKVIAGRARLVVVQEKGAGPARNGGVAEARGDILAFTDSDCVPGPEWISAGVQALSSADFIGGEMKVLVDDPKSMTPSEAFEYLFAFENKLYIEKRNFTVTANLFCPSELFEKVGGFRVGLSEDIEWSHRALGMGYKIGYAPGAIVWHPARKTWPDLERKWARINTEFYLLHMSKRNGWARYILLTLYQIPSAIFQTGRVLRSRDLDSWRKKIQVAQVLYRLRLGRFAASFSMLLTGHRAGAAE